MKKITFLLALVPMIGFAQPATEKIQSYLNDNKAALGLTSQDVTGWIIESEASSTSTKINNYYVKQRHNEIEIFGAVSNFWVKNGEVINVGDRFVKNAAQKVNATTPAISAVEAAGKAFLHVSQAPFTVQVLETISDRNLVLSNGTLSEDPMTAELVYQQVGDNSLRLAWDLNFYSQNQRHFWSLRVDAVNGDILEVNDMIISCKFNDGSDHKNHNHSSEFNHSFFKETALLDVQSGSYRVIPYNMESPSHGPRQLITAPHDVVASPFGWHDINGIAGNDFTITRGNNAHAVDDRNDNNTIDGISANGGATLNFDFPYGGVTAQPDTYIEASTTNLFYMVNVMHDVWYRYGFDEANGNFQQKNYTGAPNSFLGDAVQADAQDGAEANPPSLGNANFFTPVDGQRPRIQMFLWNEVPSALFINSPADISGHVDFIDNVFDPGHVDIPIAPAIIEAQFALYDDGSPDVGQTDNADGCGPAVNAAEINGKICVIRRSTSEANGGSPCTFIDKVKNAQNAGAVAVIIVNNVNVAIGMSGSDATITIPAIIISMADGEELIAKLKVESVSGKLQRGTDYVNADGDFDNGIIAHEFGHGISTRLTGGPANSSCLNNAEQMGEGWSDWFAMMMQLKAGDLPESPRGLATFVLSQQPDGDGLRIFPYTTDMSVNPLTFGDTNGMTYVDQNGTTRINVHNVGTVWATVLWDLSWAYINKYGFDPNIYSGTGGNNKVMRLIIDAMKLQPCGPSFINARDAIIAADQATTGGEDYCMIWGVFARRGMGVNASSGSNSGVSGINDQVEDFSEPTPGANCSLAVNYFDANDAIRVYPNPSNGTFTVRINQYSGKLNLQVVDINGRVVFSAADETFNVERSINLGHLQSGMYMLKVSGESLNFTKKIVKN